MFGFQTAFLSVLALMGLCLDAPEKAKADEVPQLAQAESMADKIADFGGSDEELSHFIFDTLSRNSGDNIEATGSYLVDKGFAETKCSGSMMRCFILRVTRGKRTRVIHAIVVQRSSKAEFAVAAKTTNE